MAGVAALLISLVSSQPAVAAANGGTTATKQVRILDPFSLRILAVEARVTGAAVSVLQPASNNKGAAVPPVDVPARRPPRSPFVPPGPPPWPPGPPPWVK